MDTATRTHASFEHLDGMALLHQFIGCSQPRNTRPDHDDSLWFLREGYGPKN